MYKIESAYRKLQEKFSIDTEKSALLRETQDDKDIKTNHQNPEQSFEHDIEVFH